MKIAATISQRDLLLVGLLLLPRVRSNWYFMAIAGGAIFVYLMLKAPFSAMNVLVALLASVCGAVCALCAGFVANAAQMLLKLEKNSGVLGTHEFSLSPACLQETTAFNDSKYCWSGIQSVDRLGSYILVRINRYSLYVIPRRSFGSDQEFEMFFNQAAAWKLAAESIDA